MLDVVRVTMITGVAKRSTNEDSSTAQKQRKRKLYKGLYHVRMQHVMIYRPEESVHFCTVPWQPKNVASHGTHKHPSLFTTIQSKGLTQRILFKKRTRRTLPENA